MKGTESLFQFRLCTCRGGYPHLELCEYCEDRVANYGNQDSDSTSRASSVLIRGEASDVGNESGREAVPEILDACCGGRHWWWDKSHPLAVYMDERQVPLGNEWRATWECSPDVVGDFRAMPFADESFQLVLFDPPHIVRKNLETKWSTRFYGALNPDTWQDDLRRGFAECWRVLAAGGSLVFKWSGDTSRCSPHFPAEPVVGTRWKAGEDEAASWFVFYKPLPGNRASVEVAA